MAFDYKNLKERIKQYYPTNDEFGKAVGMSHATIVAKLSNKSSWTSEEIMNACELLDIKHKDINKYFFTVNV